MMGSVDVGKSNARAKRCRSKSFVFNVGLHLVHGTVEIAEWCQQQKASDVMRWSRLGVAHCAGCDASLGAAFSTPLVGLASLVHTQILVAAHHKTSPHTP